jgi:hypothetical protein
MTLFTKRASGFIAWLVCRDVRYSMPGDVCSWDVGKSSERCLSGESQKDQLQISRGELL